MKVYRKEIKNCRECPDCTHNGKWCGVEGKVLFFDEDFPEWCPLTDYQDVPERTPRVSATLYPEVYPYGRPVDQRTGLYL